MFHKRLHPGKNAFPALAMGLATFDVACKSRMTQLYEGSRPNSLRPSILQVMDSLRL